MRIPILLALPALLLMPRALAAQDSGSAAPARMAVILDTDIGDDIDDTWALFQLVRHARADVKLVTSTYGKQEYRGKLLAKLLTAAGRSDVPVGLGAGTQKGAAKQQDFIKDYDLSTYAGKVHTDGVQAMIDTIHASRQPITLIAIGPLNTVAAALEKDPAIAAKTHFVGMHGSVRKGYGGKDKIDAEWNVRAAPEEAQRVFSAPWKSMTITPLDTCGLIRLDGENFARLKASQDKIVQTLLENYRMWAGKKSVDELKASSTLFDTVAVYLALHDRSLAVMEDLNIVADDKGFTRIDPAGRKIAVAASWKDLKAYHNLLTAAIQGR